MAKELQKMCNARQAMSFIRLSLKQQEEDNKNIRAKITPLWDNREKDNVVAELAKGLVCGRARVRAYQNVLKILKNDIKTNNRRYDLSKLDLC